MFPTTNRQEQEDWEAIGFRVSASFRFQGLVPLGRVARCSSYGFSLDISLENGDHRHWKKKCQVCAAKPAPANPNIC